MLPTCPRHRDETKVLKWLHQNIPETGDQSNEGIFLKDMKGSTGLSLQIFKKRTRDVGGEYLVSLTTYYVVHT